MSKEGVRQKQPISDNSLFIRGLLSLQPARNLTYCTTL